MGGEILTLETAKKIHRQKNQKAIDKKMYEANIKLVDENKWLKKDNEILRQKIDKAIEILDIYGTSCYETADLLYSALRGNDNY